MKSKRFKIYSITAIAAALMLCGCSEQIQYKRSNPSDYALSTPGYTVEVGEEWIESTDSGKWYPAGYEKSGTDTMVSANEYHSIYCDTTTINLPDIDDQYECLMKNCFVNSSGDYRKEFTNIETGTIGDYAYIVADRQSIESYSNGKETTGKKAAFFTSENTYGVVDYWFTEEDDTYEAQLEHTINSIELIDGSKAELTGTTDPIEDNGDTSELDALISQAEALDSSAYTEESWNRVQRAVSLARSMKANSTARQPDYEIDAWFLSCAIDALVQGSGENNKDIEAVTEEATTTTLSPAVTPYKAGSYRVGSDIPAGEYKLTCSGSHAYYCVYPDTAKSEILDNGNFTSCTYVTVSDGQLIEVEHATFVAMADAEPTTTIAGQGTFKVGFDLPAGEYEVVVQGSDIGYYAILADDDALSRDIIDNDNFENNSYISVSDGQFLEISRAAVNPA